MNDELRPFRRDEFMQLLQSDLRNGMTEWNRVADGKQLGPFCIVFTHFYSPQSLYLAACSHRAFESLVDKWTPRATPPLRKWAALDMLHGPADWKELPVFDLECGNLITPRNPSEEVLATLHTLCEQALADMDAEGAFGSGATRELVTLAVVAPNDSEAHGLGSLKRLNPQSVAGRYALPDELL